MYLTDNNDANIIEDTSNRSNIGGDCCFYIRKRIRKSKERTPRNKYPGQVTYYKHPNSYSNAVSNNENLFQQTKK